ncbi:MAG: MaoC family dehydratase [Pseudomonadota bacterium]
MDARVQPLFFEDLAIGMTASRSKVVTEADIEAFAEVSGDFNPVHIDEDYAATTPFKSRIAHGILSASVISAVFGMQLPGPGAIYVMQTLNFKAPVRIGDTVDARVEIANLFPEKRRVIFDCVCSCGDTVVLDGEAVLLVPSKHRKPR